MTVRSMASTARFVPNSFVKRRASTAGVPDEELSLSAERALGIGRTAWGVPVIIV
jgi:hypothetical protein